MRGRILITTLNSSYFHASFGLRYLYANMEELRQTTRLLEFTTAQKPLDIVETLLVSEPEIVGFGIYIWNTRETYDVIALLKKIAPHIKIVIGGPEVSYEIESQSIFDLVDYVVPGEADFAFRDLCTRILKNDFPTSKVYASSLPDINTIKLPYDDYTPEDIKNRVIYVEASRGCPYKCEFCLSSLDKIVRHFDLDIFLGEMQRLIERGVRQFKFVDRTFNLKIDQSRKILQFFLKQIDLGLFLHFELVPDRLPEELKEVISQFPSGSLQFEIGVQTWSEKVSGLVSRKQDFPKTIENFQFLIQKTNAHIHSDLIAGLPGETLESFAIGFDALSNLEPHEIQVGILKRLKGTPIIRHDNEWEMLYQAHPPFQILQTKTMGFQEILKIGRFAKFWDLYANSGNFKNAVHLIKNCAKKRESPSLFWEFWELSEFLNLRHPQRYGISLLSQVESIWIYLSQVKALPLNLVREALIADYTLNPKRDVPSFLKDTATHSESQAPASKGQDYTLRTKSTPKRQERHLQLLQ